DLGTLFPLALLAIVAILILMYRDLIDMLVSVGCLIVAIIWTFGFGVMAGVGVSTVSMAVPILVLGLGIDYGLHLVFRYREKRTDGGSIEESSGYTLSTVGEALLLATFTTVVAFLSYLTSSMQMLADFGVLSALGIVSSFIIMMLVIPATQALRERRAESKGKVLTDSYRYRDRKSEGRDIIGDISGIGGRMAASKPLVALAITGIVLVGFGYGAANVSYEFDLFDFLPEGTEGAELLQFIFEEFDSTGMSTASVLIYGDATDPQLIKAMETSISRMLNTPDVINVSGSVQAQYIGSVLFGAYNVTANGTYNVLYPAFFNVSNGAILNGTTQSDVQTLVFLLVSEQEPEILANLASVVGTYDGRNVTQILVPVSDVIDNDEALALRGSLNQDIQPITDLDAEAIVTSANIANAVVMDEMSDSQMQSLIITLAFTVLALSMVMLYLYRAPMLGVLAVIPTLVSVVAVWGTMFILDISLNVMTLTIAALTVGMGVTYGIHITHRFNAELSDGRSVEDAVRRTTRQTGKGVLGAALTTSVGFAIIGFSAMVPMQQFGIITAMAILYSYLGASLVLPSMLVLWGRRRAIKS
ncbi:MAG: MMPL family transporter, partial [Candidatus Methanomethylophilaceae archaeon]|nr:MMPL family transporter [Candidatus Methanomethylophilaceae archaeon]